MAAPLDEMTVEVEHRFAAPPERTWSVLTDVPRMAALSPEVVEAAWSGTPAVVGSRFTATNRRGGMTWTVTCHVLEAAAPRRFVWCVSAPERPSSTWSYDLVADDGGTLVTQRFRHGPGGSMVRHLIEEEGADAAETIAWRAQVLAADMRDVLAAAADLIESP